MLITRHKVTWMAKTGQIEWSNEIHEFESSNEIHDFIYLRAKQGNNFFLLEMFFRFNTKLSKLDGMNMYDN